MIPKWKLLAYLSQLHYSLEEVRWVFTAAHIREAANGIHHNTKQTAAPKATIFNSHYYVIIIKAINASINQAHTINNIWICFMFFSNE